MIGEFKVRYNQTINQVVCVWSGSASGQDFPRSLALLAFLETDTEAYVVVAVTGGRCRALAERKSVP